MDYIDRINPISKAITTYLDELLNKDYQIPTFQRNVVWQEDNVKKLWDSIYKFYPLGSILIWKTDLKLQNHRNVGGHIIADDNLSKSEFKYILDGQQRTTSLLTSLYGGKIEGKESFIPTLYVDLTIQSEDETDDESYKKRFLFWNEIDDKKGEYKANTGKIKKFNEGLIVKLIDVKRKYNIIEKYLCEQEDYKDYDHPIRNQLRKIEEIFKNYRLSFIELRNIQVSQVCQVFERINQEGKPLSIFDIMVAKTYRVGDSEKNIQEFYLRKIIDEFRETNNSLHLTLLDDLDYLQILAVLINRNIKEAGVYNITDTNLNKIKTNHIESVWDEGKKAILKTFDFFENYLYVKGPQLIPYRYFYLSIAAYFYRNNSPNYDFLKEYYWFNSFHNDDLLSNTTQLFTQHLTFLESERNKQPFEFGRFLIDRNKLRNSSYSSKGRLSRAILSLYANQEPKDWKYSDRKVMVDNFFLSTDRPNLHHIFPTDYLVHNPGTNKFNGNSLMNIAYLTQLTNLEISNKNPLEYLKEYDNNNFEKTISTHLLPLDILQWARLEEMPENSLDLFIEERTNIIIEKLKEKVPSAVFDVIDTKQVTED